MLMLTIFMYSVLGVLDIGSKGHQDAEIIGYYSWNWGAGSFGPSGANAGAAFTGYTEVKTAIDYYPEGAAWCCPALAGEKWLTLGGGNSAGTFNAEALSKIANSAEYIKNNSLYAGVLFDVEIVYGSGSTIVNAFSAAFAALKEGGLKVAVTTSHSAPYMTDTPQVAVDLVKSWVKDSNIDFLSPQLYSSGMEGAPDFAETNNCKAAGCTWDLYKGMTPKMVPSLVEESHYQATQTFYANMDITTEGFFQWKQQRTE
jgi:hypothetical protein